MTEMNPAAPDAAPPPPAVPPAEASTPSAAATPPPGVAGTAGVPAAAAPKPPPVGPAAKPTSRPAQTSAPAAARPAAPPATTPAATTSQPMRSALPVLTAIGFIFVFLGVVWIWNSQQDLGRQLADLAARPAPVPPPSVEPARVAALEARMTGLEQRLTTLENRPVPAPALAPAPAPAMSADNAAALTSQMAELEARLKGAEQRQGVLAQREALAQRLGQAQAALDAGESLGDIEGAPPALARFARTRPPTEAALRLAFPAAAAAAEQASRPSADGKSLGERVLMHVGSLVTVKQGNRVVVGAPATTVLSAAQAQLEAGDLPGALATLDGLDSAAAQAMAGWRADAKALLDARAALAQMARS